MKKASFYFVLLFMGMGCSNDGEEDIIDSSDNVSQQEITVSIPDEAFEQALIDLNFDDELDGKVNKDRIDFVTELIIDGVGISNLTGIAEFDELVSLNIRNNDLTTLDLTTNPNLLFVWAEDNQIEEVDITNLRILEKIGLDRNNLELINVKTNEALQLLTISENDLSGIDVSNNPALTDFTVLGNPLNCILVNQTQFDAIPVDWSKDEEDSYSLDCQ